MTKRIKGLVIVTMVLLVSCRPAVTRVDMPGAPGSDLMFVIREAGRLPLRELSGVNVFGIAADGQRVGFGTSWAGRVAVSKERLRAERIQVLMFCLEGFHCGAYDLGSPRAGVASPALFEFDEWNIDLAPVVLR